MWRDRESQSFTYKATKFTQRVEQKIASWWCSPKFFSVRRTVLSLSFPVFSKRHREWKMAEKLKGNLSSFYEHCVLLARRDPERCHQSQLPTTLTYCLLLIQLSWVCQTPVQGSSAGEFCPNWGNKAKENVLMLKAWGKVWKVKDSSWVKVFYAVLDGLLLDKIEERLAFWEWCGWFVWDSRMEQRNGRFLLLTHRVR